VDGYLNVRYNDFIENVNGLANIESVGGYVEIEANAMMRSMNLTALTSIGDFLSIGHNHLLPTLQGLNKDLVIGTNLKISKSDSLYDLRGLEGIKIVPGFLSLASHSLKSYEGLNNLETVGNWMWIYGKNLVDITALSKLTSIAGSLEIG